MKHLLYILCLFVLSCDSGGDDVEVNDSILVTWLAHDEPLEYLDYECTILDEDPSTGDDLQQCTESSGWYVIFTESELYTYKEKEYYPLCCDSGGIDDKVRWEYEVANYSIENGYLSENLFGEGFKITNGLTYNCNSCDDDIDDCPVTYYDYCIDVDTTPTGYSSKILNVNNSQMTWTDIEEEGYEGHSKCTIYVFEKVNPLSIAGCMNSNYLNYNPYATYDNDTCNNNACP